MFLLITSTPGWVHLIISLTSIPCTDVIEVFSIIGTLNKIWCTKDIYTCKTTVSRSLECHNVYVVQIDFEVIMCNVS